MKTVKTFVLQGWSEESGEWIDMGVTVGDLKWMEMPLDYYRKLYLGGIFRVVERIVITIDEPVKL